MPRKLKTFITNIGFFELALAAPSMKAALEAWGMGHNAFQHGFAKQTNDPKIVAATMANPGVVLRRAVGTTGAFAENPELPKDLWKLEAPKPEPVRPKAKTPAKQSAKAKPATDDKKDRAAILSFEKAKQSRDAVREKEQAQRRRKAEKGTVSVRAGLGQGGRGAGARQVPSRRDSGCNRSGSRKAVSPRCRREKALGCGAGQAGRCPRAGDAWLARPAIIRPERAKRHGIPQHVHRHDAMLPFAPHRTVQQIA
jgi:colicin import membrane protein